MQHLEETHFCATLLEVVVLSTEKVHINETHVREK